MTDHFLFFTRLNGLPQSRLGVTVSRKVGHAVCRNRIKRLIREVFRQSQASLPAGWDIVIIARSAARSIEFAEVQSEFRAFCRRQHKYHDWPAEGQP